MNDINSLSLYRFLRTKEYPNEVYLFLFFLLFYRAYNEYIYGYTKESAYCIKHPARYTDYIMNGFNWCENKNKPWSMLHQIWKKRILLRTSSTSQFRFPKRANKFRLSKYIIKNN